MTDPGRGGTRNLRRFPQTPPEHGRTRLRSRHHRCRLRRHVGRAPRRLARAERRAVRVQRGRRHVRQPRLRAEEAARHRLAPGRRDQGREAVRLERRGRRLRLAVAARRGAGPASGHRGPAIREPAGGRCHARAREGAARGRRARRRGAGRWRMAREGHRAGDGFAPAAAGSAGQGARAGVRRSLLPRDPARTARARRRWLHRRGVREHDVPLRRAGIHLRDVRSHPGRLRPGDRRSPAGVHDGGRHRDRHRLQGRRHRGAR